MKRLLALTLILVACNPAQVAIFNASQAEKGFPTYTETKTVVDLWCNNTAKTRVAWLGWDTIIVLKEAGPTPDCIVSPETAFVSELNKVRSAAGLSALRVHGELMTLAQRHSQTMANQGQIFHADPISAGLSAPWIKLGENVGRGASVSNLMTAFTTSSGHYANLTDPKFSHVGVGVAWAEGVMYTTHRFMQLA